MSRNLRLNSKTRCFIGLPTELEVLFNSMYFTSKKAFFCWTLMIRRSSIVKYFFLFMFFQQNLENEPSFITGDVGFPVKRENGEF